MLHNAQRARTLLHSKYCLRDFPAENLQQNQYFDISFSEGADPSDSGYILKAVPNKETNADETCTVLQRQRYHLVKWRTKNEGFIPR